MPVSVRRMSNLYVLWSSKDLDSFKCIARRVGINKESIQHLVKKYLTGTYSTLWIDASKNSPAPVRLNGFQIITDYEVTK